MLAKFGALGTIVLSTINGFTLNTRIPSLYSNRAPSGLQSTQESITKEETSVFDLKDYLESKKSPIEEALEKSIVSKTKETKKICESMSYSLTAGGKRIRPVLCIAACEMFGGLMETAMPCAVSLEMIHTMSLMHDDLPSLDNDDLRRGKPTNHILYGEDVAILAGDAMLSTSFEHVARETKGVAPEKILEVIVRLGEAIGAYGVAGGQVMDLECEGKLDVTVDDLKWIHTHKTAKLLSVSVATGAILGGATSEQVEAVEKFGINVGLAFQVADDVLDVTASTDDLGKTAGKDLDADKTTYPKLLGLEESRAEAQRLIDEAKACLKPFGDKAAPLLAIADYIVNRKN